MKILIRGVNWLGDVIMTIEAIKLLSKSLSDKNVHIDVLSLNSLASIYDYIPEVNRVISFEKVSGYKGICNRLFVAKKIKKQNYDACIIFPNSFDSVLPSFLAGIPIRVGFNKNGRSMMLTQKIEAPLDYFSKHHRLHYVKIIKEFLANIKIVRPYSSENSVEKLLVVKHYEKENILEKYNLADCGDDKLPLIGVCPGAAFGPAKMWGEEKYYLLTKKIIEDNKKVKVLLLGSNGDLKVCNQIEKQISSDRVINLCAKTDLKGFVSILSCCSGIVCNDSGSMHVSGALDVNTCAIFGSTSPNATKARGPVQVVYNNLDCSPCFKRVCPKKHLNCMNNIEVDHVYQYINKWYEN